MNYKVFITEYAQRHFIKSFKKKYKNIWNETFFAINNVLSRIDSLIQTSKAEKIHICDNWYIAKCEFKIVWSNESPKTSGNRIIVYVDNKEMSVYILLLYTKTDVMWGNETAWREKQVKENFKDIVNLFKF